MEDVTTFLSNSTMFTTKFEDRKVQDDIGNLARRGYCPWPQWQDWHMRTTNALLLSPTGAAQELDWRRLLLGKRAMQWVLTREITADMTSDKQSLNNTKTDCEEYKHLDRRRPDLLQRIHPPLQLMVRQCGKRDTTETTKGRRGRTRLQVIGQCKYSS